MLKSRTRQIIYLPTSIRANVEKKKNEGVCRTLPNFQKMIRTFHISCGPPRRFGPN